mgnify:CR=1 FL=1
MRAIPEGRVVHPNVPLAVVTGPLAAGQILETSLLNHLNYQTLIATKAARIRESGRGQLIVEFGTRRGHGRGVTAGARAALIGGADFSSNVGISHALGLAPKGTHAHSMVQLFMALGEGPPALDCAFVTMATEDVCAGMMPGAKNSRGSSRSCRTSTCPAARRSRGCPQYL